MRQRTSVMGFKNKKMAGKKKTNYISYELEKLDLYIGQLQAFLDKNPPNLATDRVEHIQTLRGGTTIKVIASIEQQVNCFMDKLEKLPRLLEDVNRLRKEVDQNKKEVELRGGADRPGFMDDEEEEEEEQEKKSKKKKPIKDQKITPLTSFDDDEFYEDGKEEPKEEPTIQKQLPAPEEDLDEGDDEWLDEREEL